MNDDTEPVRLRGWKALAGGVAVMALLAWASGLDVRQAVLVIVPAVLTQVGGIEWARGTFGSGGAYSPASARREAARNTDAGDGR